MGRSSSAVRRRGAAGAVLSLGLHGALALLWVLQRPEPPPPEPRPVTVVLVTPELLQTEPRLEPFVTPEKPVSAQISPRSQIVEPPMSGSAGVPTPTPTPGGILPGLASAGPPTAPDLGAFGRALSARTGCHQLERLTDDQRERCAALIMAAPERRMRETNPHIRVAEHAAVMAKVRRAENTAPRMSCEGYRNLEPTCPNLLPDNKPEDFEPPQD